MAVLKSPDRYNFKTRLELAKCVDELPTHRSWLDSVAAPLAECNITALERDNAQHYTLSMPKSYANASDEVINDVIKCRSLFANEAHAKRQLEIIRATYYISRHPKHQNTESKASLWIRGYEVTKAETTAGIVGSFAQISILELTNGYGFAIRKLQDDAPQPQKRRTPQRHPNWGHPVLRQVDKKRIYPSIEAAQADLTFLQEEYPDGVSIAGKHRLMIGIYRHNSDPKARRVKRYLLKISTLPDGGIFISAKEKMSTRKHSPENSEMRQPAAEC